MFSRFQIRIHRRPFQNSFLLIYSWVLWAVYWVIILLEDHTCDRTFWHWVCFAPPWWFWDFIVLFTDSRYLVPGTAQQASSMYHCRHGVPSFKGFIFSFCKHRADVTRQKAPVLTHLSKGRSLRRIVVCQHTFEKIPVWLFFMSFFQKWSILL